MLYAIGDIHGRDDLVTKLYSAILEDIKKVKDPQGAQIIFLGDYVDRGPNSKEVLDFLMSLKDSDDIKHIFLYGNHEQLMEGAYEGSDAMNLTWMHNGGRQSCESFGVPKTPYGGYDSIQALGMKPYVAWITKLPRYYTIYDYIFCHSGFVRWDFPISLDAQQEALLWGRPHKGQYIGFDKWVVHGHTPTEGKPEIDVNRINVDTGGWHSSRNHMYAVVLPHGQCTESAIRFVRI